MMQVINTERGDIEFEPQEFILGSKIIDKEIAKENLLAFQNVMDRNSITFSLAYGTLLGAIRESDFISHDEDIDVAILDEDRDNFLAILDESLEEKSANLMKYVSKDVAKQMVEDIKLFV